MGLFDFLKIGGKIKEGLNRVYFSGTKVIKEEFTIVNGEKHGEYKRFNYKDWLESKFNYKKGVRDGLFQIWWDSKNIKQEGQFENGLQQGETRTYHKTGELFRKSFLHKGNYSYQEEYFKNGSKKFLIENDTYTFFNKSNQIELIAKMNISDFEVPTYDDPFEDLNFNDVIFFFGKWKVFQDNKLFFILDFDKSNEEKLDSKVYVNKQGEDKYEIYDYKFNWKSLILFSSLFLKNRIDDLLNYENKKISYANNGIMGPPGANQSRWIKNDHINIDDILIFS